jgi:hypothetical protein
MFGIIHHDLNFFRHLVLVGNNAGQERKHGHVSQVPETNTYLPCRRSVRTGRYRQRAPKRERGGERARARESERARERERERERENRVKESEKERE